MHREPTKKLERQTHTNPQIQTERKKEQTEDLKTDRQTDRQEEREREHSERE